MKISSWLMMVAPPLSERQSKFCCVWNRPNHCLTLPFCFTGPPGPNSFLDRVVERARLKRAWNMIILRVHPHLSDVWGWVPSIKQLFQRCMSQSCSFQAGVFVERPVGRIRLSGTELSTCSFLVVLSVTFCIGMILKRGVWRDWLEVVSSMHSRYLACFAPWHCDHGGCPCVHSAGFFLRGCLLGAQHVDNGVFGPHVHFLFDKFSKSGQPFPQKKSLVGAAGALVVPKTARFPCATPSCRFLGQWESGSR